MLVGIRMAVAAEERQPAMVAGEGVVQALMAGAEADVRRGERGREQQGYSLRVFEA